MQSQNKIEFFTLDTRITIQRGNIYHKKVKQDTETVFYRYIVFVVYLLLVYITVWQVIDEGQYYRILRIAFTTLFLAPLFKRIYQALFVKTWKTIIPLSKITAVTTKPLDNGLETEVTLHLQNGRKKFYTFRNAEGQKEAFVDAIEMHTTATATVTV